MIVNKNKRNEIGNEEIKQILFKNPIWKFTISYSTHEKFAVISLWKYVWKVGKLFKTKDFILQICRSRLIYMWPPSQCEKNRPPWTPTQFNVCLRVFDMHTMTKNFKGSKNKVHLFSNVKQLFLHFLSSNWCILSCHRRTFLLFENCPFWLSNSLFFGMISDHSKKQGIT